MDDQLQVLDQVSTAALDLGMRLAPKIFTAIVILAAGDS